MLQVDRVIEQLATIGRDSNSGTSNSNRYKSVKNVLQNFFISMKSLHLMLVLCWCYVQCKKFMFTALFSLFSARSKLPVSDQVNFDRPVEMPVFRHTLCSIHPTPIQYIYTHTLLYSIYIHTTTCMVYKYNPCVSYLIHPPCIYIHPPV